MRNILLSISLLLSLSAYSQQKEEGVGVSTLSPTPSQEETVVDDPYAGLTMEQRFSKAADYMEDDKWQAAKDVYDNILHISPDNFRALYFRAYANERLFHYGLARADYDAILQKEPENYRALTGRAILNEKDSHHTDALDDANLLVEQYPDSVGAWVVRANIEEQQGHLSLAEFDYLQAYQLNPSKKEYILQAIDLQLRQKKKEDAKRNLDNLVKAGTPKNSLKHYYKKINMRNP